MQTPDLGADGLEGALHVVERRRVVAAHPAQQVGGELRRASPQAQRSRPRAQPRTRCSPWCGARGGGARDDEERQRRGGPRH